MTDIDLETPKPLLLPGSPLASASSAPDDARAGMETPRRLLDYVFFQTSDRIGSEQAQALTRIIITVGVTLIFVVRAAFIHGGAPYALIGLGYSTLTVLYYKLIENRRTRHPVRQYLATSADLAILGYAVYLQGVNGLSFYPLFLWVTIGNGLRFGSRQLWLATAVGLPIFLLATLESGLARSFPDVVLSMLAGLAIMPKFFMVILRRLAKANQILSEQHRAARHMATHDALTGLPNRASLEEHLRQLMLSTRASRGISGVLFLDLDNFKTINDSFGHDHGDILLRAVAQCMRASVRQGDNVIRFGGDEFIILIQNAKRQEEVLAAVEHLLNSLRRTFEIGPYQAYVTCSCGVALFPQDGEDPMTLVKHADTAMYRAKEAGRNSYSLYNHKMSAEVSSQLILREALRHAIAQNQLCLHYQPVVEMPSRRVLGVEALLRWQHPERGLISPAIFIPLAEESGMIVPLGHFVLSSACRQLQRWSLAEHTAGLSMAVNISPVQFRQFEFVDQLLQILRATGANPRRLKLELTESLLVSNVDDVIAKMRKLKEIGITFSLDDFGTGYSSLAYLSQMPLDQLKIDRSFVSRIETDERDAAICAATISLAHSLKLNVVAEGVETTAQSYFLATVHHCDMIQGFLFSRPLTLEQFEALPPRI
jgi:diguanylate cyclase (GGDEF)-like protein